MTMTDAGYRSAWTALDERLRDAHRALEDLRRPSALRRAVISPATRHELAAAEAVVADALRTTALAAPASLDAITTLEDAASRLGALLSRVEEEVRRVGTRERSHPAPAPPRSYHIFQLQKKRTFSLARHCPELLPGARPHGAGVITEVDHGGARLSLVVHGVRFGDIPFSVATVECLLRTGAPRGPSFSVVPRAGFDPLEGLLARRNAIPIAPDFDAVMLVRGQADVATEVLAPALQAQLLAMRWTLRYLVVEGGTLDLAWKQPSPTEGEAFPREAELELTTSLAQRLHDA